MVWKLQVRRLKSTKEPLQLARQWLNGPLFKTNLTSSAFQLARMSSMKKQLLMAIWPLLTSPSKSTTTELSPSWMHKAIQLSTRVASWSSLTNMTKHRRRSPSPMSTWVVKKLRVQRLKSMQVRRQKELQLRNGHLKLASLRLLT